MRTLTDYRHAWEDFQVECDNLANARRWAINAYSNATLDEDEAREFVERLEAQHAHEPLWRRTDRLMDIVYGYRDC